MTTIRSRFLLPIVLLLFNTLGFGAPAGSALVPLNGGVPPQDLLWEGEPLDTNEAEQLRQEGTDLSQLEPAPNDVYQPQGLALHNRARLGYPASSEPRLTYVKRDQSPRGLYRATVKTQEQTFRLVASLQSHTALATAALLRLLGYQVDSPAWFPRVKISFSSQSEREAFLGDLSEKTLTAKSRWIVDQDDINFSVTLQDMLLEPADQTRLPLHWQILNPSHVSGSRPLRALLVIYALMNIPESINLFPWNVTEIKNQSLAFVHPYADAFRETTLDDLRWISRKLSIFNKDIWAQIITEGRYPREISALLTEKMAARRNQLLKALGMPFTPIFFSNKLTLGCEIKPACIVKNGKVLEEHFPGYAARFTHGDPQDPLTTEGYFKYAKIEAISQGMGLVGGIANQVIQNNLMTLYAQQRDKRILNAIIEQVRENPYGPVHVPIGIWGGPTIGFPTQASRSVLINQEPGQASNAMLVDTLSAGLHLGGFLSLYGLPFLTPSISGGVQIKRSYMHLRPIADIKTADETSWKQLWIPGFMKQLASVLNSPVNLESENQEPAHFKKFLEELKDGEMFVIADSVQKNISPRVTVPVLALLMPTLELANSVSLSAAVDARAAIVRRTLFARVGDKIHVYLDRLNAKSLQGILSVNVFIEVAQVGRGVSLSQSKTNAFLLDTSDLTHEAKAHTLRASLTALLRDQNPELISENYEPLVLEHSIFSKQKWRKILAWKKGRVEELHTLKATPQRDDERNIKPEDFQRTFLSHRVTDFRTKDFYGFFFQMFNGISQNALGFSLLSENASAGNNILQTGQFSEIQSAQETTPGRNNTPTALMQERWTGLKLSQTQFTSILDQLESKVTNALDNSELIDRNNFADLQGIKFYEILSTLVVKNQGVEKLGLVLGDDSRAAERLVSLALISKAATTNNLCKETLKSSFDDKYRLRPTSIVAQQARACWSDWMDDVARMAKGLKNPNPEMRLRNLTALLHVLQCRTDLGKFLRWLGETHVFYQIRITGFRVNQETGDEQILSSTIGSVSANETTDVFRDLAQKSGILVNEIFGRGIGTNL